MTGITNYPYSKMDRPRSSARKGRKRLQFGGAFQVLLGLLFLGANTLVLVFLGFGWYFGIGFGAGAVLILTGSVAVHKARTSTEPKYTAVKVLSCLAALLSLAILGVSGTGVYFDMFTKQDQTERVSSTISMAGNIVMAFLGLWGLFISLWIICNSSSSVEDTKKTDLKNSMAENGTATGKDKEKWAQSRKSLTKDKVNYDNAVAVNGDNQMKKKKGSIGKIPRQSKTFDRISMNPDPDKKTDVSSSDYSDESYDDDDEGYDESDMSDSDMDETAFDGVDMNDPEAVAAAKRARRRRRRRKRYKKFELVKGEKKVTKAIDPFSKDRKIKRTWDKKPKNEFKMTKAQEIRMKKLQEQKEKEAKKK